MNKNTERKHKLIEALTEAQKLAFAPLTFQAINSMLEFRILKEIDSNPCNAEDLIRKLNLSEYTVNTLLEVAKCAGIIEKKDNKYSITYLGEAFLYDEMTQVNFNFVKDVCYQGASKLSQSFKEGKALGLKDLFSDAKTIYPNLSKLPEKMKKSWYEFDHYYSDNCFDIIYKIISPVEKIFDIGGNTGRFERVTLKFNPNQDITMIDFQGNIDLIKNDDELKNCKFHAADILDKEINLPPISGAVLMSQFLDCFSKEQIIFILKKIAKVCDKNTKIYILEPFIDKQKFLGAEYSLVHTSLYFTCMANGYSKMYSYADMEKMILESGFKINFTYENLGAHDYTLLECIKND